MWHDNHNTHVATSCIGKNLSKVFNCDNFKNYETNLKNIGTKICGMTVTLHHAPISHTSKNLFKIFSCDNFKRGETKFKKC